MNKLQPGNIISELFCATQQAVSQASFLRERQSTLRFGLEFGQQHTALPGLSHQSLYVFEHSVQMKLCILYMTIVLDDSIFSLLM
jgi:hypothetical protein